MDWHCVSCDHLPCILNLLHQAVYIFVIFIDGTQGFYVLFMKDIFFRSCALQFLGQSLCCGFEFFSFFDELFELQVAPLKFCFAIDLLSLIILFVVFQTIQLACFAVAFLILLFVSIFHLFHPVMRIFLPGLRVNPIIFQVLILFLQLGSLPSQFLVCGRCCIVEYLRLRNLRVEFSQQLLILHEQQIKYQIKLMKIQGVPIQQNQSSPSFPSIFTIDYNSRVIEARQGACKARISTGGEIIQFMRYLSMERTKHKIRRFYY